VGPTSRALNLPVYVNKPTYAKIKNIIGKVDRVESFETGADFSINGISVSPFSISHDCADPCAFLFGHDGKKVGIVTDSGVVTTLIEERLKGVDYLVIESNHDPEMLKAGPYPWKLKQRIASRSGHLSNEACVEFLETVSHPGLQGVTFAHLSKINNNPDLVGLMAGFVLNSSVTPFYVASQDTPGDVITVE
jgi:phosphoribosyl 1,2-cyclic phosphodiesterase